MFESRTTTSLVLSRKASIWFMVIAGVLGLAVVMCAPSKRTSEDPEITARASTPKGSMSCVPDSLYTFVDAHAVHADSVAVVETMATLRKLLLAYETVVRTGNASPLVVGREMAIRYRWRLERIRELNMFQRVPVDQTMFDDLAERYNTMIKTYLDP